MAWNQPIVVTGSYDVAVRCLCELLGTGLLVLWPCMACLPGWEGAAPPLLVISLGTGLSVMTVIQAFGHISGAHVNPSVTLGAVVLGVLSLPLALAYWAAQCLGAVLGYGLFLLATPQLALGNSTTVCVTVPHQALSTGQAIIVEAVITLMLVLVTCAVWDPKNTLNTDSTPLKFGFLVTVINLAAAPFTGASMNPARSLGPAVWTNFWERHWVYWVGPLLGATIGAVLYRGVFLGPYFTARPKPNT